jgi:hypothetical protein
LVLNLTKASIKGINVISEYLNIAISIATKKIAIDGMAAISAHIFGAIDTNNE